MASLFEMASKSRVVGSAEADGGFLVGISANRGGEGGSNGGVLLGARDGREARTQFGRAV